MQGGTMILNISSVNKKYNTDIVLNNFSLTMDKKTGVPFSEHQAQEKPLCSE